MAVMTVMFYTVPAWSDWTWLAMGLASSAAVVLGVVRNRPRRRLPWLALSGAILTYSAGDTAYNLLTGVFGYDNPFPSIADGFYLLGTFPLIAFGLLGLVRTGRDWASVLDSLTLAAGLGLLSWIFLIDPYVQDPELTGFQKAVSIAYPIYDMLVLVTIARMLVLARRTPSVRLLAIGGCGLLVADVLYGLIQLNGEWRTGTVVDLGWVMFYTAWGAAALHPSMASLTEPMIQPRREVSTRLLLLLTLSSLIPPAALLVESLDGHVRHGTGIAIMSAVMFALVLSRLSGVVNVHRRALARERGMRDAGAALVSATDAAEVEAAVRAAVAELLPPGSPYRIVLVTGGADPNEVTGSRLLYTRVLPAALAEQFGEFEVVLRCPLALTAGTGGAVGGGATAGSLLVAAAETTLVGVEAIIEVLAAQAALALQRVALSREISRRRNEEYFRTLVCNTTDVIMIIDETGRIRYASPSAEAVFGSAALSGQEIVALVHEEDRRSARRFLQRLGEQSDGTGSDEASWRMLHADGGVLEVEASFRDLRTDHTVEGLVATLRDVTEQRRMESELVHRAYHDALTTLPNRALFAERLQQAVIRAERSGSVVGVLFIDLDDFKVINDTLGHTIGDDVLIAVADRLMASVRSHDTVARFGGDEFAAIIEDATGSDEIDAVAKRVATVLAEPIVLGEHTVSGLASIGVATTAEAVDGADLMRQADLALHVAKDAGKGEWRRYQPALHTAVRERMEIRADLKTALDNDEFTLRYQPIVALDGGATVGFEALVRWQHPERGLVPPVRFIGVAEESGLIVPIGGWVLSTAVAAAVDWPKLPGTNRRPYVSVNVSPLQFRTEGFVEEVRRVLAEYGLPADRLLLEITESLLLRDDEQVWTDLRTLRDLGVRIAIDDFGTGYSSLSYLRQVPIDVLKIDRSFTDSVGSSVQQRALVDVIVRLSQILDLQVVAEGIENTEDQRALADMGCAMGQGYLFSEPLGYGDALQWLRAEKVAA